MTPLGLVSQAKKEVRTLFGVDGSVQITGACDGDELNSQF